MLGVRWGSAAVPVAHEIGLAAAAVRHAEMKTLLTRQMEALAALELTPDTVAGNTRETLKMAGPAIERAAKMGRSLMCRAMDFVHGKTAVEDSVRCRLAAVFAAQACLTHRVNEFDMAEVVLHGFLDPSEDVMNAALVGSESLRSWAEELAAIKVDPHSLANRSVMDGQDAALDDLYSQHVGSDCLNRLNVLVGVV